MATLYRRNNEESEGSMGGEGFNQRLVDHKSSTHTVRKTMFRVVLIVLVFITWISFDTSISNINAAVPASSYKAYTAITLPDSTSLTTTTTTTTTTNIPGTKIFAEPETVPLIILKNGRSGSTWLKNLLTIANVSQIDPEIIIKTKAKNLNTRQKEEKIARSLSDTTGSLAVKGFTACPSLRNGGFQEDFRELMDDAMVKFPRARILIFSRSNMFRTAIASHGTKKRNKPRCSEDQVLQTSFDFPNFECELPHVMMYHKHLIALGNALKDRGYPVFFVMYEDLKRDTTVTMSKVVDFIFEACNESTCRSPDRAKQIMLAKVRTGEPKDTPPTGSSTTKDARVGDRFNIADRKKYRKFFGQQLNSTCLLDQLDAIGDPTFDECPYPFENEKTSQECVKKNPKYSCV